MMRTHHTLTSFFILSSCDLWFNICLISLGVLHCCELLEDDESKITVLNAAKLPLKSTIAAVKVKNKHQIPFFQY